MHDHEDPLPYGLEIFLDIVVISMGRYKNLSINKNMCYEHIYYSN